MKNKAGTGVIGSWVRRESTIVVLLCALAAPLLLLNLGNHYLWQDEAQTALVAKTILTHGIPLGHDGVHSFSQDQGAEYGDNYVWKYHTWLPFYVLAAFFKLFGVSTFTARLPFALFGIATIILTYFLGRELFKSRGIGLVAALILMLSVPFLILMRQCRYYAPDAFFSLFGLYAYLRLLDRRRYASATFVGASILLFHTHYIHYAALLATVLLLSVFSSRDRFRKVLLLSLVSFAINLPWIVWMHGLSASYAAATGSLWVSLSTFWSYVWTYLSWMSKHVFPLTFVVLAAAVYAYRRLKDGQVQWAAAVPKREILLLLIFTVTVIVLPALIVPAPMFRHLAPVIPVSCLLMALIIAYLAKIHRLLGAAALASLLFVWPTTEFLFEITHDYDGPIEGIVKHLNEHGSGDDIVVITYGDLPLKFYTDMRIVGGLTGEDLAPAKEADWVIIRRHVIDAVDLDVAKYLIENLPLQEYEMIVLDYPDTPFENRECPDEHRFRTAADVEPVVILRRIRK